MEENKSLYDINDSYQRLDAKKALMGTTHVAYLSMPMRKEFLMEA